MQKIGKIAPESEKNGENVAPGGKKKGKSELFNVYEDRWEIFAGFFLEGEKKMKWGWVGAILKYFRLFFSFSRENIYK